MPTNIVITMAGRGSRFYDAGYTVPKYEIVAHGRHLFDWSIMSLTHFIGHETKVIFVCLAENDSETFVRERCQALGIGNIDFVHVPAVTDGQATSAYISRERWLPDASLLIYNIDTYVLPRALHPRDIRAGSNGWVPCFQIPGDHWSFVQLGDDGWAINLAEKQRISAFASIGLYWFASSNRYVQAYERFFSDPANLVRGERYIAPLYRDLLDTEEKISIADLDVGAVHVLGTPAELKQFEKLPPKCIE
jgi:dTDP-glucose pyrophosphorylase